MQLDKFSITELCPLTQVSVFLAIMTLLFFILLVIIKSIYIITANEQYQ